MSRDVYLFASLVLKNYTRKTIEDQINAVTRFMPHVTGERYLSCLSLLFDLQILLIVWDRFDDSNS